MKLSEEEKEDITDMVIESRDVEEELTADEMFEKLGYEKTFTEVDNIKYYKDDDNVIYFVITHRTFHKTGEYDGMCDAITMQELKAINKKCKELGWLDE